jgi:hypothetical protein
MKCTVPIRPKPVAPKPAQIPLDDSESLALYLIEHIPPAMRRELGLLLLTVA